MTPATARHDLTETALREIPTVIPPQKLGQRILKLNKLTVAFR